MDPSIYRHRRVVGCLRSQPDNLPWDGQFDNERQLVFRRIAARYRVPFAPVCHCTVTLMGILREIAPEVAVTKTGLAVGCVTGAEEPLEHPGKRPSDPAETITIA